MFNIVFPGAPGGAFYGSSYSNFWGNGYGNGYGGYFGAFGRRFGNGSGNYSIGNYGNSAFVGYAGSVVLAAGAAIPFSDTYVNYSNVIGGTNPVSIGGGRIYSVTFDVSGTTAAAATAATFEVRLNGAVVSGGTFTTTSGSTSAFDLHGSVLIPVPYGGGSLTITTSTGATVTAAGMNIVEVQA